MTDVNEITSVNCANCEWTGTRDEVAPYQDFWSRVVPGEIIPAGDCPECGAFAYLAKAPEQPDRSFEVHLRQYVEHTAVVKISAQNAAQARRKALRTAIEAEWTAGDDAYDAEATAVLDANGAVVWEY